MSQPSEFKTVFSDSPMSANFHRFLEVIFHLYPEDKFHQLIDKVTKENSTDEEIYKKVQAELPSIKPFLSEITFALPALKKQKKEMARQGLQLLGDKTQINGYLEIGSTGRYISELRKHIQLSGKIYLTNDIAPSFTPGDIFERGQLGKIGAFLPLSYKAINAQDIPDQSLDLVTCHIGLHHCPHNMLDSYIKSIHRVLRSGGKFIMRDHDVKTPAMATFVSLVHTVFNLGLNVSWEVDSKEFKSFKSIDEWVKIVSVHGFQDAGARILQDRDPSDNTLICFTKS